MSYLPPQKVQAYPSGSNSPMSAGVVLSTQSAVKQNALNKVGGKTKRKKSKRNKRNKRSKSKRSKRKKSKTKRCKRRYLGGKMSATNPPDTIQVPSVSANGVTGNQFTINENMTQLVKAAAVQNTQAEYDNKIPK